ncbi:Succinate-semialdehyde dehydrogenase [NADP(+)] GabD [Mannheimia haemolytica]|uniref:NAD-dependent succinate-semialdehyde dehydrogenase n=1 Tax=Mannheimia haemolytica TaxID=75985 RepID=UPI00115E156B|nr:NAD-dependent succinate-semialdehyde dehydrogenase [Mannheimia haemolytica]MDW0722766.1 NAD-dependent succinate-semialdehyde dehydrogenase [Mannheimia haemolytica]MDW0735633.1 NAD-dependent succinate-semialdehyde dehydrogenase [Mannheimia haemolytica]TRC65787.1 NAD-dependent succinate-semialdehyde dehydrogenase [Mannheimia haemolytica]
MPNHKFLLLRFQAYINGKFVSSQNGKTFTVQNPTNGEKIGEVADLGTEETAQAIEAAAVAQKKWQALLPKERSVILRKWFELIMQNQEELAQILSLEQGKPLAESRGEIAYGASFIEWFAEESKRIYGDVLPQDKAGRRLFVTKQPIGVVAAITPWNFPNAMITRKAAPALAAGCAIVIKPVAETPLSALALAQLADQAGIPKGVFNIITSSDAEGIGRELSTHPTVHKLTFTGSTRVGKILMQQSAGTVKKLALELGGNAPAIVFDDADLDTAVEGVFASKFRNGGQTCVCANRIYVQAGIYEQFLAKLSEKVAQIKLGSPFEEEVTMGALISERAVEKVESHINDALSLGAELVLGGERHALGGTFFQPTILKNVTQEMKVAREETFAPLAPIFKFETEEEVIQWANDTEFGLAAYLFSQNIGRIWRVSEQLEYGIVGINEGIISNEIAPFGGWKESGLGREGSKYGIEEFLEIKYLCMKV